MLTSEAPSAIHWLEELGVEFTKENGGYRLARCGGASAKRLLQVGDRTGHAITVALRDAAEAGAVTLFPKSPLASLEPDGARLARPRRRARTRRLDRDPRRGRPLLRRGRGARRALDEPSRRDRRGDAHRARRRRGGARPRRAPVPPERRRVARDDAGLQHPRDDARVRRRPPERRRRGVHRLARPARRRRAGDRRRGREGQGRRDARRTPGRLPRHDAHLRARRRALAAVHAAPLPRRAASIRSPRRSSPTPSSTTRTAASSSTRTPRRRSRVSTPAARSQAARTGATA